VTGMLHVTTAAYDPGTAMLLGRRVWRRLERPASVCPLMNRSLGCLSIVERTIWDGAQTLYDLRSDGGRA